MEGCQTGRNQLAEGTDSSRYKAGTKYSFGAKENEKQTVAPGSFSTGP